MNEALISSFNIITQGEKIYSNPNHMAKIHTFGTIDLMTLIFYVLVSKVILCSNNDKFINWSNS